MMPMRLRKTISAATTTITIAQKIAPSFSSCQFTEPVLRPLEHPVNCVDR